MDTQVLFYADDRDRVYGRPTRAFFSSLAEAAAFARSLPAGSVDAVRLSSGQLIRQESWGLAGLPLVASYVEHDWAADGWAPFAGVTTNTSAAQDQALSVVNGRGRITAAPGVGASFRKWWLHRETAGWVDSEVQSVWWAGSSFASPNTPQFLHVHRAQLQEDGSWRALVVSNNIFLSNPDRLNVNVWNRTPAGPNDSSLLLGSNGITLVQTAYLDRQLRVYGVERFNFGGWFNEYACLPRNLNGIRAGDVVTIDIADESTSSPPVTGSTFDETNIALQAADPKAGSVQVLDPTHTGAVLYSAIKGTITPPVHQRFWPYVVKSWTEGTVVHAKCWRLLDDEPDDSDPARVATFDYAGANTPAPAAAAPALAPGLSGIGAAHIAESGFMEFASPVLFRDRTDV